MLNPKKRLENEAEPVITAQKLKEAASSLASTAKEAKAKFDAADPATKKKIIAGITAAAVGIAAIISAKKAMKKKRD